MAAVMVQGTGKPANLCSYCGKPLESYRMRYCSVLCRHLYWFRVYEEHLARPGVRPTIPGAWDYVKGARLALAGNRCERCGLTFDMFVDRLWEERAYTSRTKEEFQSDARDLYSLESHHVVPLYRGGNSSIENIIILCEACHKQAHKKMPGKKNPIKIKREDTRQIKLF